MRRLSTRYLATNTFTIVREECLRSPIPFCHVRPPWESSRCQCLPNTGLLSACLHNTPISGALCVRDSSERELVMNITDAHCCPDLHQRANRADGPPTISNRERIPEVRGAQTARARNRRLDHHTTRPPKDQTIKQPIAEYKFIISQEIFSNSKEIRVQENLKNYRTHVNIVTA